MAARYLTLALSLVLVAASAARADQGRPTVTFSKDVAPIFYKHCVECHRPTMFAPMSLVTFEEARPWARAIKQRVAAREMPPWHADPTVGEFRNDPRLSQQEIDTVAAWVDAGAPRGDDKDLPERPKFVDGWTIGQPDLVLTMTEAFEVPATGAVPYQYIKVPTHLTEDKWIKAIEIRPGSRDHVHHVIAYTQPTGMLERAGRPLGRTNIGGTTPNKPGVVFGEGIARLLRANSDIVLQMHYTTNGAAASDKTSVALIFATEPPKMVVTGGMAIN